MCPGKSKQVRVVGTSELALEKEVRKWEKWREMGMGEDLVEQHLISSLDKNPGCTSADQLTSFLKDSRSHQPEGEFYGEIKLKIYKTTPASSLELRIFAHKEGTGSWGRCDVRTSHRGSQREGSMWFWGYRGRGSSSCWDGEPLG